MHEQTTQKVTTPAFTSVPTGLLQRHNSFGLHTPPQQAALRPPIESEAPPLVQGVSRAPGQPLEAAPHALMEPRFRHNFSQLLVHTQTKATALGASRAGHPPLQMVLQPGLTVPMLTSAQPLDWKKKMCVQSASNPPSQAMGPTVRAISAGGAGTIATTYTPEAKDKSTKIVFIQVMRELLDGTPVKPSVVSGDAYLDAATTSDFYHVDYISGEKDPYYNGDDPQDFGPQGNAISTPPVPASTSDTPNYGDGSFPVGKTKLLWEFRTAAFSAAGADQGAYYGYVDWAYGKEKGMAATTAIGTKSAGEPGSKFESAVKLWNSTYGFKMPSKSSGLLGGLIGGGLGAAVGAGIGFAVGGPIGALVGGLLGLVAGAAIGASAGRKQPQHDSELGRPRG
jgi:hypothetical protein